MAYLQEDEENELDHIEVQDTEGILWWIRGYPFELSSGDLCGYVKVSRNYEYKKNGKWIPSYSSERRIGTYYYSIHQGKYVILTKKRYFEKL